MQFAPKPFVLPPLEDSALYTVGEAGELLCAIHNAYRLTDLRNPESSRESIIDELGDTMLMLGTVAMQCNFTKLSRHVANDQTSLIAAARLILHDTISISFGVEANRQEDYCFVAVLLDLVYSRLHKIAEMLSIDLFEALRLSMHKIEVRAGL